MKHYVLISAGTQTILFVTEEEPSLAPVAAGWTAPKDGWLYLTGKKPEYNAFSTSNTNKVKDFKFYPSNVIANWKE